MASSMTFAQGAEFCLTTLLNLYFPRFLPQVLGQKSANGSASYFTFSTVRGAWTWPGGEGRSLYWQHWSLVPKELSP